MIKKIERTSITCWSPANNEEPMLALGTVAGALDASFSSKTELEIFNLNLASNNKKMSKVAGFACNARYLLSIIKQKDSIEFLGERGLLLVVKKMGNWIYGM